MPTAPHNTILHGECVEQMNALPAGCVDLIFADPPFNIGYEYDVYHDRKASHEYLDWSRSWITAAHRALKPTGTFWLAIGDDYAAELKLLSQQIGFHTRCWVIWYYTFGVNCKTKFSRSHTHLFYFVKDPKKFTFRWAELENRIPSARQLVYNDSRGNPDGRLPDDTWVLRPQDLAESFTSAEDTWYFPRVAGTFKERAGFHGCQMPEQLLGRIIRVCSEAGELVLDPFSGSASTLVVAKKLGRGILGFDLSEDYVARGRARLESTRVGDPLDGAPEPTVSAPATPTHGNTKRKQAKSQPAPQVELPVVAPQQIEAFHKGLLDAYRRTYDGYSLDRVVADPEINEMFGDVCKSLGLPGERRTWNRTLLRLRKAGRLAEFPTHRRTEFAWEECEQYLFASEIAWRQLIDRGCDSLDSIFCDPVLAKEFDELAGEWAPDFTTLQYRWAALKLRKEAKRIRTHAELLVEADFRRAVRLDQSSMRRLPDSAGVYVVTGGRDATLYAGEANNLRQRISDQFSRRTQAYWKQWRGSLTARLFPVECTYQDRLAYQRKLIVQYKPRWNLPDQKIA